MVTKNTLCTCEDTPFFSEKFDAAADVNKCLNQIKCSNTPYNYVFLSSTINTLLQSQMSSMLTNALNRSNDLIHFTSENRYFTYHCFFFVKFDAAVDVNKRLK